MSHRLFEKELKKALMKTVLKLIQNIQIIIDHVKTNNNKTKIKKMGSAHSNMLLEAISALTNPTFVFLQGLVARNTFRQLDLPKYFL